MLGQAAAGPLHIATARPVLAAHPCPGNGLLAVKVSGAAAGGVLGRGGNNRTEKLEGAGDLLCGEARFGMGSASMFWIPEPRRFRVFRRGFPRVCVGVHDLFFNRSARPLIHRLARLEPAQAGRRVGGIYGGHHALCPLPKSGQGRWTRGRHGEWI